MTGPTLNALTTCINGDGGAYLVRGKLGLVRCGRGVLSDWAIGRRANTHPDAHPVRRQRRLGVPRNGEEVKEVPLREEAP